MNPRVIVGAAIAATTIACSGYGSGEPSAGGPHTDAPEEASVEDLHFIEGTFSPAIGPDGNTVVYRAPEGLIVIDSGRHKAHSQKILDYAKERGMPIAAIINTHWHLDHSTGNQDLKAAYPAARLYTTRAVEAALDGFLSAGAVCAEGWLGDAAALLDEAAGKDVGDREYARAAVEYYVDQIIRSESKRAEFCAH